MVAVQTITLLTILTITAAYTDLSSLYGPWIAVKIFGSTEESTVKENKCVKLKIKHSSLLCPCYNASSTVVNIKLAPGTVEKGYSVIDDDVAVFPVNSFEEAGKFGKVVLDDPECRCGLTRSAFQTLSDNYFMFYFLPIQKYSPMGFLFARNLPTYTELESFSSGLVGVGKGEVLCYKN